MGGITTCGCEMCADNPVVIPRRFGRRNPHCSNCGDLRGGPMGHEISECRYRSGMTAAELAATMPPDVAARYWDALVDRYLVAHLAALPAKPRPGAGGGSGPA